MEIRRVEADRERADALAVRRQVFVEEQGVPEARELDGRDDEATHFVAYDDGAPVGAARLREYESNTGKVERIAVVPELRGDGLGSAIVQVVEESAADAGYDELVLHAQVPVVPFYDGLGYEVTSEVFDDAGIPHREMRKRL